MNESTACNIRRRPDKFPFDDSGLTVNAQAAGEAARLLFRTASHCPGTAGQTFWNFSIYWSVWLLIAGSEDGLV